MTFLIDEFELNECVSWIVDHHFSSVAIQFPNELLDRSADIVHHLETNVSDSVQFFVIVSNCCSVDYISPQHLGSGRIQALIRFGRTCLSKPTPTVQQIPTLFVFTRLNDQNPAHQYIETILGRKKTSVTNDELTFDNSLILCDTQFCSSVVQCCQQSANEIAQFVSHSTHWSFTSSSQKLIRQVDVENESIANKVGDYWMSKALNEFESIVFVGTSVPLYYRVLWTPPVWHLNPITRTCTQVSSAKELRRRVASIEKVKHARNVGIVMTHSYPNVDSHLKRVEQLARSGGLKRKFTLISLVQTTDECKLGNFGTLEVLVIVNNCLCSNLIDEINLHLPLISFLEFEIVCGLLKEYGGIRWNEDTNEDQLDEEEQDNKEEEDFSCKQLMELNLNRQSWYGLQVNAGQDPIGELKQGLSGIAAGYQNEPN